MCVDKVSSDHIHGQSRTYISQTDTHTVWVSDHCSPSSSREYSHTKHKQETNKNDLPSPISFVKNLHLISTGTYSLLNQYSRSIVIPSCQLSYSVSARFVNLVFTVTRHPLIKRTHDSLARSLSLETLSCLLRVV